jgi:hypothetical protein
MYGSFLLNTLRALFIFSCLLLTGGCGVVSIKQKVNVPPLLGPLIEADTPQLVAEINRFAKVNSIRGKVDVQFLDTSFAECGITEKYRTADAEIILQRPGNIYLKIQVPFIGQKIAEMTSDSERFRIAVLAGDEKYRRFVLGTNNAVYQKIKNGSTDCGDSKSNKKMVEKRTVSALSGLRPQHFTSAILIHPVNLETDNLTYVRSETFVEEPDRRPRAKPGARIMRGYYVLDELSPPTKGTASLLRRFWFDRFGSLRLARLQSFDGKGQLITDVRYEDPKRFGEDSDSVIMPANIELTRPQDHYSLRLTYQSAESVVVNRSYSPEIFILKNTWNLPEVDLDKKDGQSGNPRASSNE